MEVANFKEMEKETSFFFSEEQKKIKNKMKK